MGASIYWEPLENSGIYLDVGLRSKFINVMIAAFGGYPWKLHRSHIPVLEGMAAVWGEPNPFNSLIDILNNAASGIKVWPEY